MRDFNKNEMRATSASELATPPRRSRPRRPAPAPEPDETDMSLPPRRGRPAPAPDADATDLDQPPRRPKPEQSLDVEAPDDTQPPRRRRPAPAPEPDGSRYSDQTVRRVRPAPAPAPAPDAAELDQPPQRGRQETERGADDTQAPARRSDPADDDLPPPPLVRAPARPAVGDDNDADPLTHEPIIQKQTGGEAKTPQLATAQPVQEVAPASDKQPATEVESKVTPEVRTGYCKAAESVLIRVNQPDEPFDKLPFSERLEIRKRLDECEKTLIQCRDVWQFGIKAYNEIRYRRLYRAEGYTDFATYCRERLQMDKSTVNRQIAVGEVYSTLASTEANVLPTTERQMRPLLKLRKPEQSQEVWGVKVAKVWEKVVHDAEITKEKITEKSVVAARKQLGFDPPTKEKDQPASDLEKRWQKLEAVLWHEHELCPVERRRELSVRIATLLAEWNDGEKKRQPESDSPASKAIKASAPPAPVPSKVESAPAPDVEEEGRPRVGVS